MLSLGVAGVRDLPRMVRIAREEHSSITYASLLRDIAKSDEIWFVLRRGAARNVVAMAYVMFDDDAGWAETACIADFHVMTRFRGLGIGRCFLDLLEYHLRRQCGDKVFVGTSVRTDQEYQTFLRACGFRCHQTFRHDNMASWFVFHRSKPGPRNTRIRFPLHRFSHLI